MVKTAKSKLLSKYTILFSLLKSLLVLYVPCYISTSGSSSKKDIMKLIQWKIQKFILSSDTIEASSPTICEEVPPNTPYVVDGMVLIQQIDTKDLSTFGDVSASLLDKIAKSNVVYFVTDQYQDGTIKSFERDRRQAEIQSIRMKVERKSQKCPKQWKKFLRDAKNKIQLLNFLIKDWTTNDEFLEKLSGRTIFFNVESKFYKLTCDGTEVSIFPFFSLLPTIIC